MTTDRFPERGIFRYTKGMEYSKKFIAVDLETTGLDMRTEKIMEVGACEFELHFNPKSKRVEAAFGKTFSSLVNPEITPSETALAITGIKKEELTTAPKWKDVKEDLQNFLGDAVVVGHNVEFDLGYLRNQGLRLKNLSVDTLELARTLVPLLESHSLESLAEGFGVLKDVPHRALVDCQNTARVGAEILNAFLNYPKKLQTEIKEILAKSKVGFLDVVIDLPEVQLAKKVIDSSLFDVLPASSLRADEIDLEFTDKTIYCYPLSFNRMRELLGDLAKRPEAAVIGLSHGAFLGDFGTQKLVNPRMALCIERYRRLLEEDQLSENMARILAKVAILRSVKSLDLSRLKWSPDEVVFLHYFSVNPRLCIVHGCEYVEALQKKNVYPRFGDLETIFTLAQEWNGLLSREKLLLFDLSVIEDQFTESAMASTNLRTLRNRFAPLYGVDKGEPSIFGDMPVEVEQILNEIDLFFGVLHLVYLKREGEFSENLVIDERERAHERFQKLVHPARKFSDKLKNFRVYLAREIKIAPQDLRTELSALESAIGNAQNFLEEFFLNPSEENLAWLRFNASWVDLNLQPRSLKAGFEKFGENFSSVTIADTTLPAASRAYFQKRLGLADYNYQKCFEGSAAVQVPVKISTKNMSGEQQIKLTQSLSGRTLLLLPNEAKLAEAYRYLAGNKGKTEVLAYKFSGSVAALKKKLKNFRGEDLILLLTLHAFVKHWKSLPELDNLVILKLPFEARGSKPPLLGLDDRLAFVDAVLPRAISGLHRIISVFLAAPGSKKEINILDPRIISDYDQSFMKYLEEFNDFSISTY